MKVLHLISGGDTGGAKTHIINLCSKLKDMVTLKIICFMYGSFYDDVKKAGIDILVFEQKNRLNIGVINKIVELINNEGYQIIHCHGARANFIGMLLKKRMPNLIYITTLHSDFDLDFQDNLYKRFIFASLNKFSLKKMDYYVTVGSPLVEKLKSFGVNQDKIFVMYNGYDYDIKISFKGKNQFLSQYISPNFFKNKIIIGNLSRLYKVKGLDVFINAANVVLKKNKNVIFLIGGEGPQKEYLKDLINGLSVHENVFLLGEIKNPYDFFNAIDINIISSYSETFPYSILESTMLEKCCISSSVGSIPDLIEDNINGLLFATGDYNMLAQKILYLIENDHLIEQFGKKLSQKAKIMFSSTAMAMRQLEIYNQIINLKK
ncbi:glycosyltransferase family 4 protein [Caldicellulosiruptoraceae bacterium PP1]